MNLESTLHVATPEQVHHQSVDAFEVDTSVMHGPLTIEDASWMGKLGADTDVWDDRALEVLNDIVETGSYNLHFDTDPETVASVMDARRAFYEEVLGWDNQQHPLHAAYTQIESFNDRLILPSTAVDTVRYLDHRGLDAVKVVNTLPAAISYSPDSVKVKLDNLTALGLDAVKVVNTLPAAISLSSANISLKSRALEHVGQQELLTGDAVNDKDISNMFMLPTESLFTYFTEADPAHLPATGTQLISKARNHIKNELGVKTGPQRQEYITSHWDTHVQKLGHVALEWAGYKKLLIKPGGRAELPLYDTSNA